MTGAERFNLLLTDGVLWDVLDDTVAEYDNGCGCTTLRRSPDHLTALRERLWQVLTEANAVLEEN